METHRGPVKITLALLVLMAASIPVQIAAGADYPVVPPGAVIPVVAAGLLAWRPRLWTAAIATAVGLFIGIGSFTTPNTGDHLGSGNGLLIASTVVQLAALLGIVIAGAVSVLRMSRRTESTVRF
ncbi:hypothetical protein C8250_006860 [Streptomyces sp. So13.3]|uniref:hypothetical protein n=1 Tax=Streptomyces TaxID=1883 RepID=UPI0011070566|nr:MULTISPECIES: hypothetical protein [Streptomyces]MCZ4097912.1 hypothetical protein [Streptomyces sp. H39-C1]QNA71663.1 hypothetical protein C8250_006860 [Streptomyces sp. So13.3]